MRRASPSAIAVLPTPGGADQDGVVLRAAREHLHHAADLLVAADDGVDLALARALGEVDRVLLERRVAALGVGVGRLLGALDRLGGRLDGLGVRRRACAAGRRPRPASPSRRPSRRCSVETYSSPPLLRALLGVLQDVAQAARHAGRASAALGRAGRRSSSFARSARRSCTSVPVRASTAGTTPVAAARAGRGAGARAVISGLPGRLGALVRGLEGLAALVGQVVDVHLGVRVLPRIARGVHAARRAGAPGAPARVPRGVRTRLGST